MTNIKNETVVAVGGSITLVVDNRGLWFIRGFDGLVYHLGSEKHIRRVWKQWEKSDFRCRDLRK